MHTLLISVITITLVFFCFFFFLLISTFLNLWLFDPTPSDSSNLKPQNAAKSLADGQPVKLLANVRFRWWSWREHFLCRLASHTRHINIRWSKHSISTDRYLHESHRMVRWWQPTIGLAEWTVASQGRHRCAESALQYTTGLSSKHNSQAFSIWFLFYFTNFLRISTSKPLRCCCHDIHTCDNLDLNWPFLSLIKQFIHSLFCCCQFILLL